MRNGIVSPADYGDPERLLAACRRLRLATLVLAPAGRHAYADAFRRAAGTWASKGLARIETEASAPGWEVVVFALGR